MQTIIVADAGVGDIEAVEAAVRAAGASVSSVLLSDAADTIGGVARSGSAWSVVVTGSSAGDALDIVAKHGGASGLVALTPRLGASQVEVIAEWPELPVLAVADAADRPALAAAVDAYLASENARSELLVGDSVDPSQIAAWLVARMGERIAVEEVVVESEDGWQIHGTLCVPQRDEPVPGVVLLHTGRSDRTAYARLQRLLADQGLAVLNIDWRGRGKSTNLGTYFDLDDETKFTAWRDAAAAFARLAADDRVDGNRLAGVGCVHGAEYAVRAAWRDRRVKALVILTGYRPHEPEEESLLVSGEVDVMYVNSTGHSITGAAIHDLCRRAPRGRAQLVEYAGSAIGYQLFELDPDLEPRIAIWLAGVLA